MQKVCVPPNNNINPTNNDMIPAPFLSVIFFFLDVSFTFFIPFPLFLVFDWFGFRERRESWGFWVLLDVLFSLPGEFLA